MKDHYTILEISKDATEEQIKAAYKKLAKKYHPDLNKEESSSFKMRQINESYEVLGDKEKKKEYDISIEPKENKEIFNTAAFDFIKQSANLFTTTFVSEDLAQKGEMIKVSIKSSEIINGVYTLVYPIKNRCPICRGIGLTNTSRCNKCRGRGTLIKYDANGNFAKCPECEGLGYKGKTCTSCNGHGIEQSFIDIPKKIVITPQHIKDGKVTIRGIGNYRKGGVEGDVYLTITAESEIFITVLAEIFDMYLGNQIEIETPSGKVKIRIPKMTQSGSKLRIKGAGINKENVIITVMANVPQHFSVRTYDEMLSIMNNDKFSEY